MRHLFVLLAAFMTLSVTAAPISDEALKNLCREAAASPDGFEGLAEQFGRKNDLSAITPQQVSMVFEYGGIPLEAPLRKWLAPVLDKKAEKDVLFAYLAWKHLPANDGFTHGDEETAALIRFLSDKKLQTAIDAMPECVSDVFNAMATMKDANWHAPGFAASAGNLMKCNLPELAQMECIKVFNSVARVDSIDADVRENLRQACLVRYEQLEQTFESARKKKICREHIAYLNGPFAKGTLVGGSAPELHFLRTFGHPALDGREPATLSDLRGKVVLIDFWGTKCVPCILSFPEMAELQKHFEGKDVVILGVTSLQGYFFDKPTGRTIQCRGDKEKELSCFPPYIEAMGMNWTIAVSEENVMNTDYGVLAIPHVAIIDREGRVRYNAVNADVPARIAMIEALLSE